VIGAGAVGAAIARELAKYDLQVALLEAGPDVGAGTSKASTAIWHTGFDAKPGSLEARLLQRSYPRMAAYAAEAGIPIECLGAILVAWSEEQRRILPTLLEQAQRNGITNVRLLSIDEIYAREPHLKPGVLGGLYVADESILCTFTIPLAYATQAVINGVVLKLNYPVCQIERRRDGAYTLQSPGGSVHSRYIVNAAGLYSDEIDRKMGYRRFSVTPRRGELLIFDKFARRLVNHVLLPVPTAVTKGVLISPTVYGNVLLGPTAEDLLDKKKTATSSAGMEMLMQKGGAILPALLQEEVTASYAGLRAATEQSDYQIHLHADQCYLCVGGIRSTGVSASLGIADYCVELLAEAGLPLFPRTEFKPVRMPYIGESGVRPYQCHEQICIDPAYGEIICHCERVTRGEIRNAVHAVIPGRTVDGLRRRTRVLQGRCQGFNCHAAVLAILAEESGQRMAQLLELEVSHA
jgi:glycerol-3-phosphate dehydrogenase